VTSRATAGLASNVCGSVFGLLMTDEACTYFPPTWAMTSAYSFSAPTAAILVTAAPPVALAGAGEDDEQALAGRAAARGRAATRRPERVRMNVVLQAGGPHDGLVENENCYGNHFH
jgi:hypothetical protein